MSFEDKLDKILLSHGAEQGELHYSLKQAIKDLVLSDVVGEDDVSRNKWDEQFTKGRNYHRKEQRLIINGKESNNE